MSSLPRPGETLAKTLYWYWSIKHRSAEITDWKMNSPDYIFLGETLGTLIIPTTVSPLNETLARLAAAETQAIADFQATCASIQLQRDALIAADVGLPRA